MTDHNKEVISLSSDSSDSSDSSPVIVPKNSRRAVRGLSSIENDLDLNISSSIIEKTRFYSNQINNFREMQKKLKQVSWLNSPDECAEYLESKSIDLESFDDLTSSSLILPDISELSSVKNLKSKKERKEVLRPSSSLDQSVEVEQSSSPSWNLRSKRRNDPSNPSSSLDLSVEVDQLSSPSWNLRSKKRNDAYNEIEILDSPLRTKKKKIRKTKKTKRISIDITDDFKNIPTNPKTEKSDSLFGYEFVREIPVKVRWKTTIFTKGMKMNEAFPSLFSFISTKTGVPKSRLYLFINDTVITEEDTPASINLKIFDIIECDELPEGKTITLKLQGKEIRTQEFIQAEVDEPILKVIEVYASRRNLNAKQISLKFDGVVLDPSQTPEEHELEEGFCIDVIVHP